MKKPLDKYSPAQIHAAIAVGGTHRQAGALLGVSHSAVGRWLRRQATPTPAAARQRPAKAPGEPHAYFRAASPLPAPAAAPALPQRAYPASARRLVITCATNATPVHQGFFSALQGYCQTMGAELLVIPLLHRSPGATPGRDDWWSAELAPYIFAGRREIAPGLTLLADIKTPPAAADPLAGLHALTGTGSGVVGHPQVALTTLPTFQHRPAKIMATTGAVTLPNYPATKAGALGEFSHSLSALIVEIDSDNAAWHIRHIAADEKTGDFHDLEFEYYADGTRFGNGGVAAIVLGDAHVKFIDPDVTAATFVEPGCMVKALHPAALVWHDLLDFYAGSHHHRGDPLIQFAKHRGGHADIRAEIQQAFDFVAKHSPAWCKNVIAGSNHNDHLGQWVRATDPRKDPENAELWAELYAAMLAGADMGPGGATAPDPLQHLAGTMLACNARTIWLGRAGAFAVHGVELSLHGDKGPNGARGSRQALAKIGEKSIVGHSHSPGIKGGCYQVGTSSRYDLEYAVSSPGSWAHTHCILYKNGKRTLINVVNGRWRLENSDSA